MRILIILTFILAVNSCNAQSESEKQLIGKWILVAETDNSPDIEPFSENDSESEFKPNNEVKETSLTFNKNKTIFINRMGDEYNSTYKLTDSILTIGNRNYVIVEIDKKKLIFKDKDGFFDKHYEYKKTK